MKFDIRGTGNRLQKLEKVIFVPHSPFPGTVLGYSLTEKFNLRNLFDMYNSEHGYTS